MTTAREALVWDRAAEEIVRASIETMSTMHRPFGLMQRLVRDAATAGRCVFRWSVIDTAVTELDVVYGGGGSIDAMMQLTSSELLRMTDGEVMELSE